MDSNKNIILIGPLGAGKSTIGKLIAKGLKRDFVDTDHHIMEKTGVTVGWIFDVEGEEGFRHREHKAIKELCTSNKGIVISTGGGSILREDNRKVLKKNSHVIFLEASIEQQLKRTRGDDKDDKRPLLRAKDKKAILLEMRKKRQPLYQEIAHHTFVTEKLPPKTVANDIIKILKSLNEQS